MCRLTCLWSLGLLVALGAGCGGGGESSPDIDSGIPDVDGGGDPDVDASNDPDAGNDPDASIDAGNDPDASIDAGPDASIDASPDANNQPGDVISPVYPGAGESFFAWVKNDGTGLLDASGTACDPSQSDEAHDLCLHAGIMRTVVLADVSSCAGVTVSDSLNALVWICDDSGTDVRAVSTRFQDDKQLSDLLDFASTPAWRQMSVTASAGGTAVFTSDPALAWSDAIVADPSGSLSDPNTIYVITQDTSASFLLLADEAGFIVAPGATLTGSGPDEQLALDTRGNFNYVEGSFTGPGARVIEVQGNDFGILRNITVSGGGLYGLDILGGGSLDVHDINVLSSANGGGIQSTARYSRYTDLDLQNTQDPGLAVYRDGSIVDGIVAVNSSIAIGPPTCCSDDIIARNIDITGAGLFVSFVRGLRILHTTVRDFGDQPIQISSSRGVFLYDTKMLNVGESADVGNRTGSNSVWVRTILSQAPNVGFTIDGNDVLLGVTVSNVAQSAFFIGAHNTILAALSHFTGDPDPDVTSDYAFNLDQISSHLRNVAATQYSGGAIFLNAPASESELSGIFRIDSTAGACDVSLSVDDAPIDENCAAASGSTVQVETGDSSGGVLGAPDFALATSDTVLRARLTVPTGNDAIVHRFGNVGTTSCEESYGGVFASRECTVVFLDRSYERFDDGIGNDNGLCQSNEACIFMPNIGAYQGEGALVFETTIGTGGTLENIDLYRFEQNGR